jgi:type IV pilus assembly protein PilA
MKTKKSFTLVELMVVVAIIGILTAIVVVNTGSIKAKSRDTRRISDINMVAAALQLYYADNHAYPVAATFDELAGTTGKLVTPVKYLDSAITINPYPGSGYPCNKYFYAYDSSTVTYRLYFTPENISANASCPNCGKDSSLPATCPAAGLNLIKNGQSSSTW